MVREWKNIKTTQHEKILDSIQEKYKLKLHYPPIPTSVQDQNSDEERRTIDFAITNKIESIKQVDALKIEEVLADEEYEEERNRYINGQGHHRPIITTTNILCTKKQHTKK